MKPDQPPALFKTGKREVAYFLLAAWILASLRLFVFLDPKEIEHFEHIYATYTTATFIFVTSAFGMQVYQQTQAQAHPWPHGIRPTAPTGLGLSEHHRAG